MALSAKYGNFTKDTDGTGNQSVTSVGFLPKALILWTTGQTAAGFAANDILCIGYSDGATDRCWGRGNDDNVATTNSGRRSAAKIISIISDGGPTVVAEADLTTFDSDGFSLDWTTNDANASIIHYLALGAIDLTNAIVLERTVSTATGNVGYTGAGFLPEFALFLGIGTTITPTSATNYHGFMGAAVSATKRWVYAGCGQDGQTMGSGVNAFRTQVTTHCFLHLNSANAEESAADFVSFDSDGFTLNWTNAGVANQDFYVLLLKGGAYDVGVSNKPTGGAPQTQTVSGLAFDPQGVFLASFGIAATATITADSDLSVGGASSGSSEGSIWSQTKDNVINTEANRNTSTTKALTLCEGSATLDAECDATLGTAQFELNWTTNNAVASQILYFAVGSTVTAGVDPFGVAGIFGI
jgi:hypothetical protein